LETRLTPTVVFAAQQTLAVGSAPSGAAVADFNGDGRPDLATADHGANTVSVRFNQTVAGATTPTFTAASPYTVGNTPLFVVAADFNGDGRPDLAVLNNASKTVSVLLSTTPAGAATPSFAVQQTFAIGAGASQMVAADFNGDGRPDLAVANFADNSVTVLLDTTPAGAATVSFSSQTFAVGAEPEGITAADFNGDGRPDLVVTNYAVGTVSVLLNTTPAGNAAASFAARQTFATGTNPRAVIAADLNGDGLADLAVANSTNKSVSVLVSTTAPAAQAASFAAQQTFAVGTGPFALAAADLSGEGRLDLAVANDIDGTASVLENTTAAGAGTVSFAAQQTFAVGSNPEDVLAVDFNADGRPDLVASNTVSNTASVLLNTKLPFAQATPVVVGQFGTTGVWEYNRPTGTWGQLTSANASVLAADPQGDLVGDFPGNGVWEYRPVSGWKQINGVDATVLAMDANGDIAASFPGYGVGEYLPASGWRSLTPSVAYLLAMDNLGEVAGAFHGYGIQLFRPASGWVPINGVDTSLLAMDPQGDVFANFHGVGVAEYQAAAGWKVLNGVEAQALTADGNGDVFAQFAGYGVGEYVPAAGWHTSTLANAAVLAADAAGAALGEFLGNGVWEYDSYLGWHQIRTQDATLLAIA
jgi:hypothetical protein